MIEYFSQNLWQVWAIIAVVSLILELFSGDFFIMCFAIGACGAAIVSPFANIYVQLAVFVVITAISIFVVRPFALRYLHKAIDGDDWKAVSADGSAIAQGTPVRVVGRESIIITVETINS